VSADDNRPLGSEGGWVRGLVQGLGALAVLGAAAAAVAWFMSAQPAAERSAGARAETAVLVETARMTRQTHRAVIEAWGEVVPANRVEVTPRVSGEVVTVSDKLEPGGRVRKGDVLVELDRADYRLALERARTRLDKAQADLKLERGNQKVAEAEAELLNEELSAQERELVLRRPQLDSARADVAAAKAEVAEARLELERTIVRAPFDAVVRETMVEVGSQVAAGQAVAELIGTDQYHVELALPASKLAYVTAAENVPGAGSRVRFDNPSVWGDQTRTGEVVRVRPTLSEQGRMARLLVAVPAPLDRTPRLMVGAYLRGRIQGRRLGEVVALDRAYLRPDDSVWVMSAQDRLEIRAVDVTYRGPERVYVSVGLSDGDRVVTSDISTPTNGMKLRTRGDDADAGGDRGAGSV
jgi:RND family efflux transporter MFP subunit